MILILILIIVRSCNYDLDDQQLISIVAVRAQLQQEMTTLCWTSLLHEQSVGERAGNDEHKDEGEDEANAVNDLWHHGPLGIGEIARGECDDRRNRIPVVGGGE